MQLKRWRVLTMIGVGLIAGAAVVACGAEEDFEDEVSGGASLSYGQGECNGPLGCEPTVTCGGAEALACPGSGTCVADPRSRCRVSRVAAESKSACSGICACNIQAKCKRGTTFNASPEVCACVSPMDPCARIKCTRETECVAKGNQVSCVVPTETKTPVISEATPTKAKTSVTTKM